MLNLFKKSKVRSGKGQTENVSSKKEEKAAAVGNAKKGTPLVALGGAWAKLNKMDRKQAYTWGAVAVVGLIALLTLGSAMSASDQDNFDSYESRGYDLANMPFSTDEAEQYLLASKYPDMKENKASGLYSKEEKEARQAEDAEQAVQQPVTMSSSDSGVDRSNAGYRSGRYYGGGGARNNRGGGTTQVGQLGSANVKGASGSGLHGTFGATGDFSNFRSQDKGSDKFDPKTGKIPGTARQALFQTRVGSRAAASLKNDKLVNAKRAMMGGNIEGAKAFMDDSGAVNLSELKGLELDKNAPISSTDLSKADNALKNASDDAKNKEEKEKEKEFWEQLLEDLARQAATGLLNMGLRKADEGIDAAIAAHNGEKAARAELTAQESKKQLDNWEASRKAENEANSLLGNESEYKYPKGTDGSQVTLSRSDGGDVIRTTVLADGTTSAVNLSAATRQSIVYNPIDKRPTAQQWEYILAAGQESSIPGLQVAADGTVSKDGKVFGKWENKRFSFAMDEKGKAIKSPKVNNKDFNKQHGYDTYIKDHYGSEIEAAGHNARNNVPVRQRQNSSAWREDYKDCMSLYGNSTYCEQYIPPGY